MLIFNYFIYFPGRCIFVLVFFFLGMGTLPFLFFWVVGVIVVLFCFVFGLTRHDFFFGT